VSDLAPLKDLPNLQSLDCSSTQVSDLAPLKDLPNLQSLDCSSTQVSDLAPLKGVPNLQSLYCSGTQVSDLAPLKHVPNLQSLYCSGTQVSDLAPLKHVPNLQSLDCSGTQVSDLAPLKGVPNLQSLYCSSTQVSDLAPLKDVPNLQSLYCSGTQVSDLAPLKDMLNLQSLVCSQCTLRAVPDGFWMKSSLAHVYLFETRLPGVPSEVLSQTYYGDCLDSLRTHLRDLEAGLEHMLDVKLMVLGNGRVGKTQICRRLRGEDYDDKVSSTHGIVVASAQLPHARSGDTTHLQIWDFGGQDIYHGTHALFMRSRAIFAAVWIPEAETTPEHRYGDFVFRNQPLGYWLEYIRHFGGAESPTLIVQTRCDTMDDEKPRPPVSDEIIDALRPPPKILHYSAKSDRGREFLEGALVQAVARLHEKEGIAVIGAGRATVKRKIEAMRDADAKKPPRERLHRTISYDDFLALCKEAKGISDVGQLLAYLHNAGTIFYREGLFENRIVIDQGWALEAIYAVFHREKCFRKLERQHGRFTHSDLDDWIWRECGYGVEEQKLFLSMMESCGICFQYRHASDDGLVDPEYIAPDFLPPKDESEVAQKWDANRAAEKAEFDYPLLTAALIRGIISHVGKLAGVSANYWRDGLYAYEATTRSRGLIEQRMTGLWKGQIIVQTQGGQAALLLERLVKLVKEEEQRIGIISSDENARPAGIIGRMEAKEFPDRVEATAVVKFVQEPVTKPEYFVSYAWGDTTPEERTREAVVDHICGAAEQRGITILRDKKVIGLGERVSKFMQRLGRGDRVFVILSDKYLKSPYCMNELFEFWRNRRQDDDEFLGHIRVYALPTRRYGAPWSGPNMRSIGRVKAKSSKPW
jgi:internalin A